MGSYTITWHDSPAFPVDYSRSRDHPVGNLNKQVVVFRSEFSKSGQSVSFFFFTSFFSFSCFLSSPKYRQTLDVKLYLRVLTRSRHRRQAISCRGETSFCSMFTLITIQICGKYFAPLTSRVNIAVAEATAASSFLYYPHSTAKCATTESPNGAPYLWTLNSVVQNKHDHRRRRLARQGCKPC